MSHKLIVRGKKVVFSAWTWAEPILEKVEKIHPVLGPVTVGVLSFIAGGVFFSILDILAFVVGAIVGVALVAAFAYSVIRCIRIMKGTEESSTSGRPYQQ